MTTATPRQTAGNNATLARVKQAMNGPTYREVLAAYNADGRDAARAVLSRCFNEAEAGRARLAEIFDGE
jgi:hypothetical protein